jgi:hypothetical protein
MRLPARIPPETYVEECSWCSETFPLKKIHNNFYSKHLRGEERE